MNDEQVTTARMIGRMVIEKEILGLQSLWETIDDSFETVVDFLFRCRGRIFITGIGKSGHVGRKIAATLASTGTPAFFIHSTEASHGDLGMIGGDDMLVALSNSGETQELSDILHFCSRGGIQMVGITSRAQSTLAGIVNHLLLLPPAAEACLVGMAPTTSTTMMMALGDAIAVALMHRRGFTNSDFSNFHPGGRLGQKLTRVEKLCRTGDAVPLVGHDMPMTDVLITITSRSVGCAGVVDDQGRLIGVITDGDLRRHMEPNLLSRRAGDVMTPSPRTTHLEALVGEAMARMNKHGITCLFVVADDRPVGIITLHDCLRAGFS
jgi:arabinose-5-phosphate isomerase